MRAYLVAATVPAKSDDQPARSLRAFAGSQGDAASVKRDWLDKNDSLKRSAVRIDPVDIPTDKVGLLGWLNKNLV